MLAPPCSSPAAGDQSGSERGDGVGDGIDAADGNNDSAESADSSNDTTTGDGDTGDGDTGDGDSGDGDSGDGDSGPKFDLGAVPDASMPSCNGGGGMGDVEWSNIWISNSPQGTVSKIDTMTAVETARYYAGPNADPSRTSVNLLGDVAVVDRNGGIMKVAARLEDCVDQNNSGMIDTPYGGAVNQDGDFFVLGWSSGPLIRIDSETLAITQWSVPPSFVYGVTVDQNGDVWVAGSSTFHHFDVDAETWTSVNGGSSMRGAAAHPDGYVWFANPGGVVKADIETKQLIEQIMLPGVSSPSACPSTPRASSGSSTKAARRPSRSTRTRTRSSPRPSAWSRPTPTRT